MAGGFHSTSPLCHSVAFVASVTSKLPSALKQRHVEGWPGRRGQVEGLARYSGTSGGLAQVKGQVEVLAR
jgi:hypothetical protein